MGVFIQKKNLHCERKIRGDFFFMHSLFSVRNFQSENVKPKAKQGRFSIANLYKFIYYQNYFESMSLYLRE